jgi:hypothetical protein
MKTFNNGCRVTHIKSLTNNWGNCKELPLVIFSISQTKFAKTAFTFFESTLVVSISPSGNIFMEEDVAHKAKFKNFFFPRHVFAAGKISPDVSHNICRGFSQDDYCANWQNAFCIGIHCEWITGYISNYT